MAEMRYFMHLRQLYLESERIRQIRRNDIDSIRAEFEMNGWATDIPEETIEPQRHYFDFHDFVIMRKKKHCPFCKTNKESKLVYTSHYLKDVNGKITCPVLRNYVCPICFATEDRAHTLKYCPFNQ